jgi:ribonuclease Z
MPDTQLAGLLIDTGGEVYSALCRAQITPDGISDLLITHAHIDHIGSLPSLIECYRLGGRHTTLRIWALPEVLAVARRLVELFGYELTLDRWPFAIEYMPLASGQDVTLAGIPVQVLAMDHALPSVGVRLALPGGPVAYTCDTQPAPAVRELGSGARVLITECTFLRGGETDARMSKHTTAFEAGQEAAACGVEMLALVHIGGWPIETARAQIAESFSGTILFPNDGDSISV